MRRLMRTRKIGHAGTLDPAATGVLIIGVERGTKFMAHMVSDTKSYDATIRLGFATTTDDAEGNPIPYSNAAPCPFPPNGRPQSIIETSTQRRLKLLALEPDRIDLARTRLTGTIMQRPSSVSAIKVNGRRAYDLTRAGEDIMLPERPVTIFRFDIHHITEASINDGTSSTVLDLTVSIDCSSGTYIRALARDLGDALGVGGHLTALRRTRVGSFTLTQAKTLEQLQEEQSAAAKQNTRPQSHGEPARASLSYSLDDAIIHSFPTRQLTHTEATAVSMGKRISASGTDGTYAGISPDGRAIALMREHHGVATTVFVARPATLR